MSICNVDSQTAAATVSIEILDAHKKHTVFNDHMARSDVRVGADVARREAHQGLRHLGQTAGDGGGCWRHKEYKIDVRCRPSWTLSVPPRRQLGEQGWAHHGVRCCGGKRVGAGAAAPGSWAWASSPSPVAFGLSDGLGCSRDSPLEAVVVDLQTKVLPDLVGAGNGGACGRRFPPWGRCHGARHPSVHHSKVKTQTRLAGLDDGSVFGRRYFLGGVIFRSVGRRSSALLGQLVGSTLSGVVDGASAAGVFAAAASSTRDSRSARRCRRAGVVWRRSRPSLAR